jgi:hypothetical protein
MRLNHFSLEGLIGALVFLAGAHLLWKNRGDAISWLKEFIRILRGEIAQKGGAGSQAAPLRRPRSGALILVGALALIVIGQILFFLDLTY